jgi:hypothetical protein
MKDRDSELIFEKYESLQSQHAKDEALKAAGKAAIGAGVKRLAPKLVGGLKASPITLPLAVGEIGAGSMERYHVDQALKKNPNDPEALAYAAKLRGETKKAHKGSSKKLIKGSNDLRTEETVSINQTVIVDRLAALSTQSSKLLDWIIKNFPEMENHPTVAKQLENSYQGDVYRSDNDPEHYKKDPIEWTGEEPQSQAIPGGELGNPPLQTPY